MKNVLHIIDGELLIKETGDDHRRERLGMATNSVFMISEIITSLECEGYIVDIKPLRKAIDELYAGIEREKTFILYPGEEGRFTLENRKTA